MSSILETLLAAEAGGSRTRQARPILEAQCLELRQRFDRYRVAADIEPGMFVREKHGIATYKPSVAIAWIVLRKFDITDPADAYAAQKGSGITLGSRALIGLDWLCARLTDDGLTLDCTVFDRLQIEPVPLEEIPEEAR